LRHFEELPFAALPRRYNTSRCHEARDRFIVVRIDRPCASSAGPKRSSSVQSRLSASVQRHRCRPAQIDRPAPPPRCWPLREAPLLVRSTAGTRGMCSRLQILREDFPTRTSPSRRFQNLSLRVFRQAVRQWLPKPTGVWTLPQRAASSALIRLIRR